MEPIRVDEAYVVEKNLPEGDLVLDDDTTFYRYWRNGHSGNEFYGASRGWWPLSKARLFQKQNDAIKVCVDIGSDRCVVRRVGLYAEDCRYPDSQKEEPIDYVRPGQTI